MHNNVWIITSTINTPWGLISPAERFAQTLNSIESVRTTDVYGHVLLMENSHLPDHMVSVLSHVSDTFLQLHDRSMCKWFNCKGIKGAGEAYLLLVALDWIHLNKPHTSRIFKLSGRYVLQPQFDISAHMQADHKWCFKSRHWSVSNDCWALHTRMFSVCGHLMCDAVNVIGSAMKDHLHKGLTWEEALWMHMDPYVICELPELHVQGMIAPWNQLVQD